MSQRFILILKHGICCDTSRKKEINAIQYVTPATHTSEYFFYFFTDRIMDTIKMMNESIVSLNTSSLVIPPRPLTSPVIVMLLLVAVNFTLTLPSGLWAAWVMMRSSRATLEAEFFSVNLLFMEIICAIIILITTFSFYLLTNPLLLEILLSLGRICLHSQPVFQCSVCVERYIAVVHPIIFLRYKPMRYKAAGLAVYWFIAGVFAVWGESTGNFYSLMAVLLLVMLAEMFCSLSILVMLKRSGPGESKDGERQQSNLVKKKAFTIVSLLQVKLMVNYLPLTVVSAMMELLMSDPQFLGDLITLGVTFCFFGSFIQPLMYLHRVGRLNFIKRKQ